VSLRMLNENGVPLKRRYYSEDTGRDLDADEIVRGYEVEKGTYVVITDEELERLAPERSRDIDLRLFVDEKEIPPLLFERGYFLTPSGGSVKAYKLLAETMEKTGRAGIATFVMRGKEYLIAILAENGLLRAETLRFNDELRSPKAIGLPEKVKPVKAQVQKFAKAIEKDTVSELPRKELKDRQSERLLALVEKKQSRKKDVVGTARRESGEPEIVDILTLLQQRLGQVAATKKKTSAATTKRKAS